MAGVTSTEIEATLRAVGAWQHPDGDELQGSAQREREPHPFDVISPERGCARWAAATLAARGADAPGDADLWALTLESAVAVAVRFGDLDTAAALGRAAALVGPAAHKAADSAAAFIVSRRTAEGGFLRPDSEGGCEPADRSTAVACVRALRTIAERRSASAPGKAGAYER